MSADRYDVIILGAGITGASLGLVLARQGLRVAVIDRGTHPRFALGESLLKPTVLWLRALARRFGVDELATVANLNRIHAEVAPTSGVKKSFGFVRHRPGATRVEAQWWANIAVSYAEDVLEAHLFRQDIDAFLATRLAASGARVLLATEVRDIVSAPTEIRVHTAGALLRAAYLVDTTGQTMGIEALGTPRETPTRLRTDSRTLYTHLVGVRPFDQCAGVPRPALAWHEGTLHHLLDGAWMWVIPFDNHPLSTNPLVSVGVNFDNSLHPDSGQDAEEEWQGLLATYPLLAAQFGTARAVRPWVRSARLQVNAAATVGQRHCLLAQAAGSVDALFSRGLLNSVQSLYLLAELLLDAHRDGDHGPARFAPFATLQANLLALHDGLVHGSYRGFRAEPLTDWWLALWSFIERLSLTQVVTPLAALELGDDAALGRARGDLLRGECIPHQDAVMAVVSAANGLMDDYVAGRADVDTTAAGLTACGASLAPLGFDPGQFRALASRHGFSPPARRLLGCEHALTAAIEVLDRHAGLPLTLRRSTIVNALVRLLATRRARSDDVDLGADELAPGLTATVARLAVPGFEPGLLDTVLACLEGARLRSTGCSPAEEAAAGWRVLCAAQEGGREVRLRWRRAAAEGAELELDTAADGERLCVSLHARRLPPAVLAALA